MGLGNFSEIALSRFKNCRVNENYPKVIQRSNRMFDHFLDFDGSFTLLIFFCVDLKLKKQVAHPLGLIIN